VCCKSQDISCGMRKIENWSDHFGTEIALWVRTLGSGESRRAGGWLGRNPDSLESYGQPLSFDGLSRGKGNGRKAMEGGERFDYAGD
jgi:hypothetical protein